MSETLPSTIYLLNQTGQALRSRLESQFRGLNMTGIQFTILGLLDRYSGLSSAELARRFFVTPQTMNQIIAGMLKRGLIERSTSEDNRRILHMTLSPAGRETLKQGTAIAEQVEAEAMKWMAPEAHVQLRQQLSALLRQLRTNGPTPGPTAETDEDTTGDDGTDAHPDPDKVSVL
ncbi:MarR family transcriptional regulator [Roseiarcaceae bacterium H3SJ34-1]|uniref:MarR family winged helix-turn-helix transcriptional regulator n=1 Tax=Terripilifer ovatus TaxID=3032367 RepID=UPI003AB94960|nr:MarR family transcriptional regulator [Roseiarcaceae bacterium H3SJ34-1]